MPAPSSPTAPRRYRTAPVFLALLVTGLAAIAYGQVRPRTRPELRPIYQVSGYSPADRFSRPEGIAIDERNRIIYVADTGKGRVVGLSLQGVPRFVLRVDGISAPHSLALDDKGRLFVADREEPVIRALDSQGKVAIKIDLGSGGARPVIRGLAIDHQGHLYVGDTAAGEVLVCDTEGHVLQHIGGPGDREGQFKVIEDVTVDRLGRIYVVDSNGAAVSVFDPAGKFIFQFGRISADEEDFHLPVAIHIDRQDQLWIVDQEAHSIQVYDARGVRLRRFGGSASSNPLLFLLPSALAIDRLGNAYVVEKGADRVQVFAIDNPFLPFQP